MLDALSILAYALAPADRLAGIGLAGVGLAMVAKGWRALPAD